MHSSALPEEFRNTGLLGAVTDAAAATSAWVSGFGSGSSTGYDISFDLSAGIFSGLTLPFDWGVPSECEGPPGTP